MRSRRPDLFAADRGLRVRIVVAVTMTPLLVLAGVAAVVVLAPQEA